MARSYYSTLFDVPAHVVWSQIRDFDNYTVWVDGVDESAMEDGFVEWYATFDCPEQEYARWTSYFTESFGKWLASLRSRMQPAHV
jgi:hypothetical protein